MSQSRNWSIHFDILYEQSRSMVYNALYDGIYKVFALPHFFQLDSSWTGTGIFFVFWLIISEILWLNFGVNSGKCLHQTMSLQQTICGSSTKCPVDNQWLGIINIHNIQYRDSKALPPIECCILFSLLGESRDHMCVSTLHNVPLSPTFPPLAQISFFI